MPRAIEVPHSQVVMSFVATCIEATARTLGVDYSQVYDRMMHVGMIENYIYPNYEVLHTESRDNIAKDMVQCMQQWEARQ